MTERKTERKMERKEDRKSFQSWIFLSDIAKEDPWLTWNSAPNVRSRKSIQDQAWKAVGQAFYSVKHERFATIPAN